MTSKSLKNKIVFGTLDRASVLIHSSIDKDVGYQVDELLYFPNYFVEYFILIIKCKPRYHIQYCNWISKRII